MNLDKDVFKSEYNLMWILDLVSVKYDYVFKGSLQFGANEGKSNLIVN